MLKGDEHSARQSRAEEIGKYNEKLKNEKRQKRGDKWWVNNSLNGGGGNLSGTRKVYQQSGRDYLENRKKGTGDYQSKKKNRMRNQPEGWCKLKDE